MSLEVALRRAGKGRTHSTVARFEQLREVWPSEAWSLVLDFVSDLDRETCSILCCVRFLVPENAPSNILVKGARFELFEGHSCVADGVVL